VQLKWGKQIKYNKWTIWNRLFWVKLLWGHCTGFRPGRRSGVSARVHGVTTCLVADDLKSVMPRRVKRILSDDCGHLLLLLLLRCWDVGLTDSVASSFAALTLHKCCDYKGVHESQFRRTMKATAAERLLKVITYKITLAASFNQSVMPPFEPADVFR